MADVNRFQFEELAASHLVGWAGFENASFPVTAKTAGCDEKKARQRRALIGFSFDGRMLIWEGDRPPIYAAGP